MAQLYQAYKDSQAAAREAFGKMLRLWRERNGWTQYTVERWGKEAGFATISSGNVSMVEQGKAGDLRAQAHFQLADVNRRLADHNWGPLHSPDLIEALRQAAPITGDDGLPWGPAEFWSCYVGLLPVPEAYQHLPASPAPSLSPERAAQLSAQWRQQVTSEAAGRGLDPIETLQGAARQAPAAQRKTLRAVLAGFRDYRPEELLPLWDGDWLPQRWIDTWQASLPGDTAKVEREGGAEAGHSEGSRAIGGDLGGKAEPAIEAIPRKRRAPAQGRKVQIIS